MSIIISHRHHKHCTLHRRKRSNNFASPVLIISFHFQWMTSAGGILSHNTVTFPFLLISDDANNIFTFIWRKSRFTMSFIHHSLLLFTSMTMIFTLWINWKSKCCQCANKRIRIMHTVLHSIRRRQGFWHLQSGRTKTNSLHLVPITHIILVSCAALQHLTGLSISLPD